MSTDSTERPAVGFIGLGNMGQPIAGHIVDGGFDVGVFDLAGTQARAPRGATIVGDTAVLAARSDVIFLSLPTVDANRAVVEQIRAAGRRGAVVVDTCTIGVSAAQDNAALLAGAGIGYVDAPVSGLRFRAVEGTLATMVAGEAALIDRIEPMLNTYSRSVYRVGEQVGHAQRMKVVNNALCMAHYVVVSEALSYGEAGGLDMAMMLDVINASSGQNFSTSVVFPKHVVNKAYDSGADAAIIEKDLALFIDGAAEAGTSATALAAVYEVIERFKNEDARQDAMRIYPFVKGSGTAG